MTGIFRIFFNAEGTRPWLVLIWAACTLPVVPLLWPTPEHRGTMASGAVAGSSALGVPYDVAVRSRFFKAVTAGYVLVLGMQVGGITHLVKLGNERAGDGTGGKLIAGLTIASVVARLIGGVVADKRPLVRLAIGFSANDRVGHAYGPTSHEVMDISIRTDRLLARLFEALDREVGLDHVVVVLTADHGVAQAPESLESAFGRPAGFRLAPDSVARAAGRALRVFRAGRRG